MMWLLNHAWLSLQLAVAGVWQSALDKGMLYAAILLLVALAYGSQFLTMIPIVGGILADFFKPLRKDLLWAAFGCVLVLVGEYIGARDAKLECVAKTVVIERTVDKAVTTATSPAASGWRDPWDDEKN